ncbi:MAG: 2-oxoglutarate dehydrogenase complex dihydrolipoyllysine-residue succinyltransferase [Alphaproteobacteria bacterium]
MSIEIRVPSLGESVSEATVAKWLKKAGDNVVKDEAVIELETDKVTLEVNAPESGILGTIAAAEGSNVAVGAVLGLIEANGGTPIIANPPAKAASSKAAEKSSQKYIEPAEDSGPAVRKLLAETQAVPSNASGKDGRLTKGDVLLAVPTAAAVAAPVPAIVSAPAPAKIAEKPVERPVGVRSEERVKMTRLRQRVAERLKESQNTAAMLTTFNEVDMTEIMALRQQYREVFEKKHGVKLGFMSFFVKASIAALQEFPVMNAEVSGTDIVYKHYYDLGVAVSAPQGLVVPVLRNAEQLGLADIEKKIAELGKKGRDGKLSIDELTGGTFTITNGGIFGSLMSTPILNPPQSAILGMHKIQERPMAINGKVEIRPMMYLAVTYDHRIIDGREAVGFLVKIKENIENPERLLLGV